MYEQIEPLIEEKPELRVFEVMASEHTVREWVAHAETGRAIYLILKSVLYVKNSALKQKEVQDV